MTTENDLGTTVSELRHDVERLVGNVGAVSAAGDYNEVNDYKSYLGRLHTLMDDARLQQLGEAERYAFGDAFRNEVNWVRSPEANQDAIPARFKALRAVCNPILRKAGITL
ncbi:hypothetical protein [Embleya sp. NBC_00896]|uniref:hypothetical protein n=1 Tax=Embleya sp. NBC_00896 TaxID=2975961 RepID=UPI0038649776|nr:hypothetical protein OG928_01160 [Embleya sp. NBC_00896]